MLKIAAVLLSLLWVVAPTFAHAQALTLTRVKTLLSEAGYKNARISDGSILVDGFGEAGHTFAFTVADEGASLTIGAYWRIPSDKQGSVPTMGMLRANSSSDFMFGLNGEDGALGLQIETTYAAALVSKTLLKRSVEQLLATIEGNEELWNTDGWPAKPVAIAPQAATPVTPKPLPLRPIPSVPPRPCSAARAPRRLSPCCCNGSSSSVGKPTRSGTSRHAARAPSPQGEELFIDLQPVGLTAAPASDGRSHLGLGLDYEVRTRNGTVMVPRKSMLDQEVSFTGTTPPQLYVSGSIEVVGFAPGDYTITFTLRDVPGHRTAAADLPFTVTPAAPAKALAQAPVAAAPSVVTPPAAAAMLGDTPATKALGRAVAQFIAKPGRLVVGLKAKSTAGVGAVDLAGASNRAAFLDKVDLTAEAR